MGSRNQKQLRAALHFISRPLLLAVLLTAIIRLYFMEKRPYLVNARYDLKARTTTRASAYGSHHAGSVFVAPEEQTRKSAAADTATVKTELSASSASPPSPPTLTKAIVVASTSKQPLEDISWLGTVGKDWSIFHYVTDAPLHPDLAVPLAKGNEAMAYLTYIIDHYERLPDVVLFHHGHRRAWHQAMDSIDEVRLLRADYVARVGYVSIRCLPGCENIIPLASEQHVVHDMQLLHRVSRDVQLTTLLHRFLGRLPRSQADVSDSNDNFKMGEEEASKDIKLPTKLASPCCAQFAASRTAIQRHSRTWWRELRQWLIETPVRDLQSGRLMEHTWHVWLSNETYHCPSYEACRCHVFGIGECDGYFSEEEDM